MVQALFSSFLIILILTFYGVEDDERILIVSETMGSYGHLYIPSTNFIDHIDIYYFYHSS